MKNSIVVIIANEKQKDNNKNRRPEGTPSMFCDAVQLKITWRKELKEIFENTLYLPTLLFLIIRTPEEDGEELEPKFSFNETYQIGFKTHSLF